MADVVLIGVDGGASKVLAHRVDILEDPIRFAPVEPIVEVSYDDSERYQSGFRPHPLADQLAEHRAGDVHQLEDETRQESAFLDSFCKAIAGVYAPEDDRLVVIGIGLPGLKTPDRRGISAMANGPRMPRFLDKLGSMLAEQGYSTLHRIHALGSDADYCGLGEHWGAAGAMRDVSNAYYLGIGTGVADALLLGGEPVPFDATRDWMAKTWEIMFSDERSYEAMVSAQGIQRRYGDQMGLSLDALNTHGVFPWQIFERAVSGEDVARTITGETCEALAQLILHRIVTLARGFGSARLVDSNRRLSSEHPYIGQVFDRIIIGQRLGDIWQNPDFLSIFRTPVQQRLAQLLQASDLASEIKTRYLTANGRLRSELIVHSELRNAPALGAAVDAYFNRT
jgi:predicted NBD/HSP70 family sugar kinase